VLVIPALALLYTLAQRSIIEETSRPEPRADRSLADTGLEPL
jgi:hypothetical protein